MIWCVDDDSTIRDTEIYTLTQTGFEAKGFCDGISMLEALKTEKPDLIVLDIMLPKIDGTQVLKKIRSNPETAEIPVIMATAKDTEPDKIRGLDLGADDYLTKPFGVMEMVSRIKAVLRRCTNQKSDRPLSTGKITLNEDKHKVFAQGKEIVLTRKEFEILKCLIKNPEVVFSRERLLSEVWGVDYLGESRTVDMHIKTLRKKLGESADCIKTVIGIGYKLEE